MRTLFGLMILVISLTSNAYSLPVYHSVHLIKGTEIRFEYDSPRNLTAAEVKSLEDAFVIKERDVIDFPLYREESVRCDIERSIERLSRIDVIHVNIIRVDRPGFDTWYRGDRIDPEDERWHRW